MTGVQTCALPICFPVTIEVDEYLVHVSFKGKPYDCMVFQDFDTFVEYFRSHESYGLTYDVVMRATTEYNCRVSFDGEIPF